MKPNSSHDARDPSGVFRPTPLIIAGTLALLTAVITFTTPGWPQSWPQYWPGLLLPLSLSLFLFTWLQLVWPRCTRPQSKVLGLLAGLLGAHLALWFPFLLLSYLGGHGAGSFDYSIPAALITSLVVGWYTLGDHLWTTLGLITLAVLLHFAIKSTRPT